MHRTVSCFVCNCHICWWFKLFCQCYQDWLQFLSSSQCCWHSVFMNYVKSLFFSIFMKIIYQYILVFIDCLIKMWHLVLIISMKLEKIINVFYQHVWKLHELSDNLISDWEAQFISEFWKLLCKWLKIHVNLFTADYSETNDQIEHVNVIMKHYFQIFINYFQNDWMQWFFDAEFAVNNTNFFSILTLFFLANYKQHFCIEFEFEKSLSQNLTAQNCVNLIAINEFIKCMKNLNKHLQEQMLVI